MTATRVAVLDHTAALGGAELALCRLLDALDDEEFAVHVILFADGPLVERLRTAGHEVEVLPLARGLSTAGRDAVGRSALTATTTALRTWPFVWRLGRRIRALDVDLVHTTSLKADLVGVPAAWIARRPLVWHVHDRIAPDYLPARMVRLVRLLARRFPSRVIANSLATAGTLENVPDVAVAYPGVSPSQVLRDGTRPEPGAGPVIGMIGRISETKGQVELVRAAARVLEVVPGARFRIVGSPMFGQEPYARRVREEIASLGLGGRVELTGFVADPAVELDAMTVCVHASTTPEPFGQVIVEAMVRGVPVIATRGGGVVEIVQPHGPEAPLGLLVPPSDPEALAAAIIDVLERPDLARERATAARAYAVAHFSVAASASVVAGVWRSVARSRPER